MAFHLYDAGGVLREITAGEIKDGTGQRGLRAMQVFDGTDLLTVATFVQPLALSATDASKLNRTGTRATITASSTATPGGGLAPYTYVWTRLTGTFALSSTSSASISFTETLDPGQTSSGTAKVVCTDATGATAEATITVTLTNADVPSGGTE